MRNFIILSLLVLIAAVTGSLYIEKSGVIDSLQNDPVKQYVDVITVKYKEHPTEIRTKGEFINTSPLLVPSHSSGEIIPLDIPFQKGVHFKEGRTLFKINDPEMSLQSVKLKQAFIDSINQMVTKLRDSLPDSYRRWNRFLFISDPEKPLPELPDIETGYTKVLIDSGNIIEQHKQIEKLEKEKEKYSYRVPYDGIIDSIYMSAGEFAEPGDTIIRIFNKEKLMINTNVKKSEINWLYPGTRVTLYVNNNPWPFNGEIHQLKEAGDHYNIKIRLPDEKIENMSIGSDSKFNIILPGKSVENAIEIPEKAVVDSNFVYIVKGNRLIKKPVRIHKRSHQTYIISGLPEGTLLVTENSRLLHSGLTVYPEIND